MATTAKPKIEEPPVAEEPVEVEEVVESAVDSSEPEAINKEAFLWKGVTFNFTDYDEVRMWQALNKQRVMAQFCYLCKDNTPLTEVPVADHAEALAFLEAFQSVMPRVN